MLGLIYISNSCFSIISQASVPNWLREEIKKAVIAAPSVEHSKEETQFTDDNVDKSYVQSDEPDSKSNDSSRSVEEEEDEEVLFFYLILNDTLHDMSFCLIFYFNVSVIVFCLYLSYFNILNPIWNST